MNLLFYSYVYNQIKRVQISTRMHAQECLKVNNSTVKSLHLYESQEQANESIEQK